MRQRYLRKPDQAVTAICLSLQFESFSYQKWGDRQQALRGDWLVDNEGDVYTVAADSFARTYRQVGPGRWVKTTPVWAEQSTQAGAVATKEGRTHHEAGDWLVSNSQALVASARIRRQATASASHAGCRPSGGALMPLLTAMLGPGATAATMVVTVLKGLREMNRDDPWVTLFDRASSHASGAKFQLGFVDADATGATVTVRLMAVAIDAKRRVTQVLFFRVAKECAKLAAAQGELTVPAERLNSIRQAVADKVAPFVADNISRIEI